VSIAALAWSIYNDQRTRAQEPTQDSLARQIRITLRSQETYVPTSAERITEVVATEIIRGANPDR
jgi:hypothetical protein